MRLSFFSLQRFTLTLTLSAGLLSGASAQTRPAQMTDIIWDSRGSYTRFVLEFSQPIDADANFEHREYNLLPNQSVVYIDFYNLRPTFREQRVSMTDGLLNDFEIVNYENTGVVRLVFVLENKELFSRMEVTEEGYHLTIDLLRRGSSGTAASRPQMPRETASRPAEIDSGQQSSEVAQAAASETESTSTRRSQRRQSAGWPGGRRPVVIVDPGHGGSDLGARSVTTFNGRRANEADVNLEMARELKTELEASGFEVHLTRERDRNMTLEERVDFANEQRGDVFISVHANHAGNPSRYQVARGLEIYFLSEKGMEIHCDEELDNSDSDSRAHDVELRLVDSKGRRMRMESRDLCMDIGRAFMRERYWQSERNGGHFRFIKSRNFHVLRNFEMPCVLVETGYMTNNEECRLLQSEAFQRRVAHHISAGVMNFFAERDTSDVETAAGG